MSLLLFVYDRLAGSAALRWSWVKCQGLVKKFIFISDQDFLRVRLIPM